MLTNPITSERHVVPQIMCTLFTTPVLHSLEQQKPVQDRAQCPASDTDVGYVFDSYCATSMLQVRISMLFYCYSCL